jgi:hypothetical protein
MILDFERMTAFYRLAIATCLFSASSVCAEAHSLGS